MITDRQFERFILEHSSPEDPLLEDLFRETHIRFVNPNRISGHLMGKTLELISKMINPTNILEIGTFTGYSAICLAKGLRPGGLLITIDHDDELADFSRSWFAKAGLESKIRQMTGEARDIIPALDRDFDLVFIDGDKREYVEYFNLVMDKVVPGGFILADNVLWGGKALDRESRDPQTRGIIAFNDMIRQQDNTERLVLPVRDGLMLIRKTR
ncbi:MAG: O-methyltransferase [Bacteroidales bacterium]|nr:O-methyltransferase [Bacteroidales bacterium]